MALFPDQNVTSHLRKAEARSALLRAGRWRKEGDFSSFLFAALKGRSSTFALRLGPFDYPFDYAQGFGLLASSEPGFRPAVSN